MKLSLIIEALNRASKPIEAVGTSLTGLGREAKTANGGLEATDRAMRKSKRSAEELSEAGYRFGFAIGSAARRGVGGLLALERRMQLTREQMGWLAEKAGGLIGGGIAGGVIGAAGLATAGLYKVVTAGMMFEKFRTQLTGLMGSVAAGDKAMQWVTDFARTTPYEISEVMEAFVALKAYGIDPTDGSLRILGDTAGGMGKSLSQAVEMIADAQTGEFERLKEFGIKASQKGDQVTFSFMRNGQQMTRTAQKTGVAITRTLYDIFKDRFAGGMDRLAATTEGKWSNVMDRMTISAKRVWEGGLSASVNVQLDRFSGWIDKLEADGSLKKWAGDTGRGLGDLVKTLGSADWAGFGADVRDVAGALKELADAARLVGQYGDGARKFINGLTPAPSSGGLLGNPARRLGQAFQGKDGGWRGMIGEDLKSWLPSDRFHVLPWNWQRPGAPRRPGAGAKSPAPGNAKISLHVTTDRGVTARPTAIAARGVDLDVNTGRAMGGFA